MESLSNALDRLDLQAPKVVTFVPSSSDHGWNIKLDPIPQYLFRVFDSTSPGESNDIWIRSKVAVRHRTDAEIDIFKRRDRSQAAHSLWGHLMWKGLQDDDLMSWTSSLLFAIQYIFYRHNSQRARPSYMDIKICVLDTQKFAQGAFIRDIDLIEVFAPFDEDLREVARLRGGKHYFGEYLSQGALNIAGHNTIVSAQDMINKGLLLLRPEFSANLEKSDCGWANDVVAMYDMLEQDLAKPKPCQTLHSVRRALHVAQLFGRNHQLHVAMSLVAIVPGQIYPETIAQAFREADFSSE
jgi:hypothetical protein